MTTISSTNASSDLSAKTVLHTTVITVAELCHLNKEKTQQYSFITLYVCAYVCERVSWCVYERACACECLFLYKHMSTFSCLKQALKVLCLPKSNLIVARILRFQHRSLVFRRLSYECEYPILFDVCDKTFMWYHLWLILPHMYTYCVLRLNRILVCYS